MGIRLRDIDDGACRAIQTFTAEKEQVLLMEVKKVFQMWGEPDFFYIEELGIKVFSAVYEEYATPDDEYYVSYDLYAIYDADTGEELYMETGSSFAVTIHNYCYAVGMNLSMDEVYDLEAVYVLDDGKFLMEKVLPQYI